MLEVIVSGPTLYDHASNTTNRAALIPIEDAHNNPRLDQTGVEPRGGEEDSAHRHIRGSLLRHSPDLLRSHSLL